MSNVIRISDLRVAKEEKIEQQEQVRKVSVDDGFTAIPNALLDAILEGDFTKNQIKLILGVIRKTTSWHKEMDWICNEQLAELCHICDKFEASRIKQQLLTMNVLVKDGRKIGVNLLISEWKNQHCRNSQHCEKHTQQVVKTHNKDCRNSQPQKETITKEKINITPLPPKAKNRKAERIDYQRIADLFNRENEDTGSRLPMVVALNDKRKRDIKKFLGELKAPTAEYAENYFSAFFENLKPFHMGENNRGWRADFDYAIRPSTVLKVREGNL